MYLVFNFISKRPISIHTNSRILVTILIKTPISLERPRPFNAKIKPPSLAPNCIGEKNIRLANKEDPALMKKDPNMPIGLPKANAIKYISKQPITLAINSKNKAA